MLSESIHITYNYVFKGLTTHRVTDHTRVLDAEYLILTH